MLKRSLILFTSILLITQLPIVTSFAQAKYNIKEMTPEVKTALENRRERYERLRQLKKLSIVGENNKGYVEILTEDKDGAKLLVFDENVDRNTIYKTIAMQNDLEDALDSIEMVFAQVQRDKAMTGDKIQTEDGRWVSK